MTDAAVEEPEYVSIVETAKLAGVSTRTIYAAVKRGDLPPAQRVYGKRGMMMRLKTVRAWIKRRAVGDDSRVGWMKSVHDSKVPDRFSAHGNGVHSFVQRVR